MGCRADWRVLECGHVGHSLPRAVIDAVGESVEALEAARRELICEALSRSTSSNLHPFDFLRRGLRLVALDPYPAFVLARLCQVIGSLPAQPEIRAGPSSLLKANGHVGRDRRVAVQHPRKSVTGNAQDLRRLCDTQAKGIQAAYFRFYNDQRPHQALGYRTPGEVFSEGWAPQDEESTVGRWSPEADVVSYAGAAGPSLNSALILSN